MHPHTVSSMAGNGQVAKMGGGSSGRSVWSHAVSPMVFLVVNIKKETPTDTARDAEAEITFT